MGLPGPEEGVRHLRIKRTAGEQGQSVMPTAVRFRG